MPIRATMLLADAAQASEGKLHILGGGWDRTNVGGPSAVAIYIQVSWDLSNTAHEWKLELLDSDGVPVAVPGPVESQTVAVGGHFEVGRPPGTAPGSWLGVPLAINLGPLPLEPGRRYEWRLTVNGQTEENWRLPFSVNPTGSPTSPATDAG